MSQWGEAIKEELLSMIGQIKTGIIQGLIWALIAMTFGAILSFIEKIDLLASIIHWIYIVGVMLTIYAVIPGTYFGKSKDVDHKKVADVMAKREERSKTIWRDFIRSMTVFGIAIILERIGYGRL